MSIRILATRGAKAASAAASATALVLLSACATEPQDAPAAAKSAAARDRAETQTGTNLPRRTGRPTAVIEVDKDAVQGAVRGASRNSGPAN